MQHVKQPEIKIYIITGTNRSQGADICPSPPKGFKKNSWKKK
jgi:hypothetical protein